MKRAIFLLVLANIALYLWRSYTQEGMPTVEDSPLPGDIERLILLTERPEPEERDAAIEEPQPADQPEAITEESPVAGAATQPAPEPACYSIGPLANVEDSDRLAAVLARAGVNSRSRTRQRPPAGGFRYLVYIPENSRAAANRIAADLKQKGISDFYVARKNFIAVGVFSSKQGAMERTREIKRAGYTTAVKEEGTPRVEYWLDALQEDTATPSGEERQAMLADYPGARLNRRDCREIAVGQASP